MTRLKVAFRNYGNAPKQISLKVNWLPPGTKKMPLDLLLKRKTRKQQAAGPIFGHNNKLI
jgi:hypothetical protein